MRCPVRIYSNFAASATVMNPTRPCGIKVREGRKNCIFHWHLEYPPVLPYADDVVELSTMQMMQSALDKQPEER